MLGISWGGGLAQQIAAQYPRRCHPAECTGTWGRACVGARHGYLMRLLAGVYWTSLMALPAMRQRTLILAGEGLLHGEVTTESVVPGGVTGKDVHHAQGLSARVP